MVEPFPYAVCPKIKTGSALRYSDARIDRRVRRMQQAACSFVVDRLPVLGRHFRVLPQWLADSVPDLSRGSVDARSISPDLAAGLSCAETRDEIPTAPSLGFGSLRRIDPGDRYHDGFPTVAIRSRGFSPPQRFDPARALWLYFTPHPPLGFGLQRVPHPVSRNASRRPCSRAVESWWLPTRTSTSERCSNRASVHPTVAVKRVIGAGALLTFAPSEVY